MSNKPREWTFSDGGDCWYIDGPSPIGNVVELPFKVIEHSAYEALQAECARLREVLQLFVEKCEGLKVEPNSFTRLDLGEIYDKATAALKGDGE